MKRRQLIGRLRATGPRRRGAVLVTAAAVAAMAAPALGVGTAAAHAARRDALHGVVTIGASVSLSGDFSATGKTTQQGYEAFQTWANEHGGILGHKVVFKFLSDGSSPTQVTTDYQKLITVTHVNFLVGPYSTLLTKPASEVANRYHMALVEGIGGGPSVFEAGLHNVFDVSASAIYQGISFAKWVAKVYKPQPVAYAAITTPFNEPIVTGIKKYLDSKGFTTAVFKVYPLETADFTPIASAIAATHARIVAIGSQPPDGEGLIKDFVSSGYNPTVLFEVSGPDQGTGFVKAVGKQNTTGVMWPNTWYPGANEGVVNTEMEKILEKEIHVKSVSLLSANMAEAFSAAQTLREAVDHIKSLTNVKLIKYMHSSSAKFTSVQGPVCFKPTGQNACARPFVFQWQHGKQLQVLPSTAPGSSKVMNPKPKWGQSKY